MRKPPPICSSSPREITTSGDAASTEVVEDQHQCRGIVVDDGRGLGAAENREAVLEIRRAAAAGAAVEAYSRVL